MARPTLEVADIFRRYGGAHRAAAGPALSTAQRRVMTAIATCRTATLGGHVEQCESCGHQRIAYNSCANRHCPKCQSLKRAGWIEDRKADLLDVEYFHVVFTVPQDVAAIAAQNKATVYNLLFRATAETLRTIAADPTHLGAELGFFAVHTWGQTLVAHPHLHCVIPGGGLSPDGPQWVAYRPGVFLPVRVLRACSGASSCNASRPRTTPRRSASRDLTPSYYWGYLWGAINAVGLGQPDDARALVRQARALALAVDRARALVARRHGARGRPAHLRRASRGRRGVAAAAVSHRVAHARGQPRETGGRPQWRREAACPAEAVSGRWCLRARRTAARCLEA